MLLLLLSFSQIWSMFGLLKLPLFPCFFPLQSRKKSQVLLPSLLQGTVQMLSEILLPVRYFRLIENGLCVSSYDAEQDISGEYQAFRQFPLTIFSDDRWLETVYDILCLCNHHPQTMHREVLDTFPACHAYPLASNDSLSFCEKIHHLSFLLLPQKFSAAILFSNYDDPIFVLLSETLFSLLQSVHCQIAVHPKVFFHVRAKFRTSHLSQPIQPNCFPYQVRDNIPLSSVLSSIFYILSNFTIYFDFLHLFFPIFNNSTSWFLLFSQY